jgi:abortive infection bacteriophage resistance protein
MGSRAGPLYGIVPISTPAKPLAARSCSNLAGLFLPLRFTKPATTYEQQADLILGRGMIADRAVLVRRLQSVGYYRLCAYWHPFKQPDNSFTAGTQFETAWQRYTFDRQLRLGVMDAIERVEVAVRSQLITELALRGGSFAHLEIRNLPAADPQNHRRFIDELRDGAQRSSEVFVEHFKATYDEFPDLPIWAAAEIMGFGAMFTLFKMSGKHTQNVIADKYGLRGRVLFSWLLTLNYIRNLCAHHCRLWNRELAIKPLIPYQKNDARWHGATPVGNDRVFVILTLLHCLVRQIAPQTQWRERVFALFDGFHGIPLAPMGIPTNWRTHELWR